MSNVIKQLKDNEKPFGLMSAEMQEKAKAIGVAEFEQYRWNRGWVRCHQFFDDSTIRLRAGYAEEQDARINDYIIHQTWENPEGDINAAMLQMQQACDVLIESVNVLFRRPT